ncbi:MAG: beta-lactamase family protein [Rhodobiaceae bacterium]|nr:beta-lactamase family protein [Rhodobiaceae bacterium]
MRQLRRLLLICLAVLPLALGPGPAVAESLEGGMVGWAREDMARALSKYLPRRMAEEDVPGLSIAVVVDGHIVFEQGYGTSDFSGLSSVTANTLFEAASLGKPVAAMGALALVEEGKLSLDVPLGDKLELPWLGDEDDHKLITLRHVLTHTSGLSNLVWCCSDESWSTPGAQFSYSGVGYMYMGHVMAHVADMPFDRFMQTRVLGPLGMASSAYGLADPLVGTVSQGFAPYYHALLAFLIPLAFFLCLFVGVTALIVRFGLNRLKLNPIDIVPALVLSLVATLGLMGMIVGSWLLLFILAYVAAFGAILFVGTLFVLLAFAFLGLLGPADGTLARGQRRTDPVMMSVAFGLVLMASLFFVVGRNVPVPIMAGDTVNPAFSLRASAHDMGRFVEGLLADEILSAEMRRHMLTDSVPIEGAIGWGLGLGVRDGVTGRTGWQWGSNPGFQSIMVVNTDRQTGVVVLTNSAKAGPLVQEIAGHVMGEEPGWQVP